MAYQPIPLSLIMPEVPAHITDGEIARLWGMNPYIRSIQMEPFVNNSKRCQRVTIHFDDFTGYGDDLREKIVNGYYKTNPYNFHYGSGGNYLLESSYLLPCETPQSPRTEYSHVVALQLQEIVRKQTEQIRLLEARLNEMETMIQEGTKLQLDINQTNTEKFHRISKRLDHRTYELETRIHEINDLHVEGFDQLEPRLQSHEDYNNYMHAMIVDLEAKHEAENKLQAQEKEELKHKIDALTEWCSQSAWKRTRAFVLPKESEMV